MCEGQWLGKGREVVCKYLCDSHKAFYWMVLFLSLSHLACLSFGLDEAVYLFKKPKEINQQHSPAGPCLFSDCTFLILLGLKH